VERIPEITELQSFLLAADSRSLSRAARLQHLSPAAVAKRLDNLEAVLGFSLFQRGPRGVQLTPEGRAFHGRAERLVRDAERLLDGEDAAATHRLSGVRSLLSRRAVQSTEIMLADIERLLDYVLESVTAGVVLLRVADAVVLEANEALCELIEIPRGELVGRPYPRMHSPALGTLEFLCENGRPVHMSTVFETPSGRVRGVEVAARRIEIAGEHAHLIVLEDITQAREAKLRLKTRVERQRRISRLGQMISSGTPVDETLVSTLTMLRDELGFDDIGLLTLAHSPKLETIVALGRDGPALEAAAERFMRRWTRGDVVEERERPGHETETFVICSPLEERRSSASVIVARGGRTSRLDCDDRDLLRSGTTLCAVALAAAGELAA